MAYGAHNVALCEWRILANVIHAHHAYLMTTLGSRVGLRRHHLMAHLANIAVGLAQMREQVFPVHVHVPQQFVRECVNLVHTSLAQVRVRVSGGTIRITRHSL